VSGDARCPASRRTPPTCDGGTCSNCKTFLRMFRAAVRRGMAMPRFLAAMKAYGEVRSEPTEASPQGRILEGALPVDIRTESVLMTVARAGQGERKAAEPKPAKPARPARPARPAKLQVGGDGPELLKRRLGGAR